MRLSPGQVAELRSWKNVRGSTLVDRDLEPLFLVAVTFAALERAQALAAARALPPALVWYVVSSTPSRVEIHSTQPEWFVELEEMIEDARRPSAR